MASTATASSSLALLQDTLNAVLLETASIFNDPSKFNSRTVAQTNAQLKDTMPRLCDSFNEALDVLEGDLMKARQIFRADLQALLTPHTKAEGPDADQTMADVKAVPNVGDDPGAASTQNAADDTDMVMVDGANSGAEPAQIQGLSSDTTSQNPPGQSTEPAASASNEVASAAKDTSSVKAEDQIAEVKSGEELPSGTEEKELDSIFEDLQGDSKSSDGAKNDASGDNNALEAADDKIENDNIDATLTNADVSSLLPGLASYTNDNGEPDAFAGLGDFGDFTAGAFDGNSGMQGMDPSMMTEDFMSGQDANTSFDELFTFGDFDNDGGADTSNLLDGNAFDESFFSLDNTGT